MKIQRNNDLCFGCRTCQLMCSFHHEKVFSLELSSIKIWKNNQTGQTKWALDSTCDGCKGEQIPVCVAYCPYSALKEAK